MTDLYVRQAADVIASRLAEQRLRDSEGLLTAILKHAPGAVGLFDLEGNLLFRGGPLAELWGNIIPSREPEAAHRWRGFDAKGGLLPRSQYPGARALRGEVVTPGIDFIYDGDRGEETWIRVSAAPFRNDAGEITILQNVNEEKHAEQRLRESKSKLQAAVDLVKLGRYAWNPQTNDMQWDYALREMWACPRTRLSTTTSGAPVSMPRICRVSKPQYNGALTRRATASTTWSTGSSARTTAWSAGSPRAARYISKTRERFRFMVSPWTLPIRSGSSACWSAVSRCEPVNWRMSIASCAPRSSNE
nr:hypothetical protein [Lichenifustis flavocetrariae]